MCAVETAVATPIVESGADLLCFRLHVETIKFFAELVAGRNILNVEFLLRHHKFFAIDYVSLLAAAANPDLPKFYRRYVINLTRNVFVDCEPFITVSYKDSILLSDLAQGKGKKKKKNSQKRH